MIYLVTYLAGWIVGLLIIKFDGSLSLIKALTLGHLAFTVGFFEIFNFAGHVFFREKVAKQIGWQSNGFQIELGIVSLGMEYQVYNVTGFEMVLGLLQ